MVLKIPVRSTGSLYRWCMLEKEDEGEKQKKKKKEKEEEGEDEKWQSSHGGEVTYRSDWIVT